MALEQTFYSELGLPLWQARPGYFAQQTAVSQSVEMTAQAEQLSESPSENSSANTDTSHSENASQMMGVNDSMSVASSACDALPWVCVGAGLAEIWQNPQRPEWRLTLNILKAFHRSADDLQFIDVNLCQTEETIMDALDKVIDLGVEQVFVFERGSALIDELQAGAELIDLPPLNQLLHSAQAKAMLYRQLCQLVYPS